MLIDIMEPAQIEHLLDAPNTQDDSIYCRMAEALQHKYIVLNLTSS